MREIKESVQAAFQQIKRYPQRYSHRIDNYILDYIYLTFSLSLHCEMKKNYLCRLSTVIEKIKKKPLCSKKWRIDCLVFDSSNSNQLFSCNYLRYSCLVEQQRIQSCWWTRLQRLWSAIGETDISKENCS